MFVFWGARHGSYMHNPRGSNDRNCERNANRDNGNRLFDSQNNANGGYACPRPVGGPEVERAMPAADATAIKAGSVPAVNGTIPLMLMEKMYYFPGSKLPIEWTAQHGCGSNPKLNCQSTWVWLVGDEICGVALTKFCCPRYRRRACACVRQHLNSHDMSILVCVPGIASRESAFCGCVSAGWGCVYFFNLPSPRCAPVACAHAFAPLSF